MHVAAFNGHIDILEKLLAAGVEVDDRDTVTTYNKHCTI